MFKKHIAGSLYINFIPIAYVFVNKNNKLIYTYYICNIMYTVYGVKASRLGAFLPIDMMDHSVLILNLKFVILKKKNKTKQNKNDFFFNYSEIIM